MGRPVKFKDAIYQAASRLFGEQGLDGTSIRQIAESAGVSEAALYRHWAGKLDLAWAVFRSGLANLYANLEERVRPDLAPYDAVRSAVECFYQLFDENYQLFSFVLLHQHDLWSRMDQVEESPVRYWFDLMARFVDKLPPEDAGNLDVLAAVTLGIVLQPAVAAVYGRPSPPMVPRSALVARAVCRVLHIDVPAQTVAVAPVPAATRVPA
ncbi:MAG TPA: TetR/AcrR family transcriptional regulator [Phycisphaerae bacterium]|mgnify:CR=1 FL=1|nr:TetR/AcrR family transcriptional regulator [Phycisphaerales bacterium]HRX83819.1 TetR/AcrR family transcriptional regulator [Phycisphaerae bacterium]